MEKELKQLKAIKGQIEKGLVNYKKSPKERIVYNYVDSRLELLETQWKNFVTKYEEIVGECEETELLDYFGEDVYEAVNDAYLTYKVELKNALSQLKAPSFKNESCDVSPDNFVRLPKITLPTFSGKYTEWSSFRDLFISLVHNNKKLDDVQRLHYLRTQLSGEAEQLIKHIPITDVNYNKCWEMLEHRFNNKKFMSTCILKRLFSQRTILVESSTALKELIDVTSDCLHELTNLGIDVSSWDVIVIYVVSLKLDVESRKQWELHVSQSSDDLPSFKQFCHFIETRFRALEFLEPKVKPKSTPTSHAKVMYGVTSLTCPHCSDDHKLGNCKEFCKEDSDKRRDIAQSLGVCFNCLGSHHTSKVCRVLSKCRICQRKHHTLLHPVKNPSVTSAVSMPIEATNPHDSTSEVSTNIATHLVNEQAQGQVLLATALIKAESPNGSAQILRALLDQGSQASFITEAAAQLLRLKKVVSKTTIAGIGSGHGKVISRHVVNIKIQSLYDPSFTLQVTAHVLNTLTSVMPDARFQIENWPEIHSMGLADPKFNIPNKIDILLGAEIYCRILKVGLFKSPTGSPVVQDTHLGWIVSGHVNSSQSPRSPNSYNTVIALHAQVEENEMLKGLWELDAEPLVTKKPVTPEEQCCEDFYKATTKRDKDGRYMVQLPFCTDDRPLNSKSIAVKRLLGLERKLARDPELKQQYSEVIKEYLMLGHLERVVDESDKSKSDVVYLPHHAVVRQDKLTTKVRVVYDASCKGTNGLSLNDTLMVGPTLQADLRHIIMRWRQHPICLAADIVKMYRQIKVAKPDTDFQRIVWREDPSKEIEDFRLQTVTFGTSCAPYLAVKSLHQVSIDEGKGYPMAADRVITDFYMDDLMTGCESENEAKEIYRDMNELLERGGFQLQKWTSNRTDLLDRLKEVSGKDLQIKIDKVTKVLGLTWNRHTDEFDYSVKMSPPVEPETKRTVISEISRLYDPLGWIAPCIITAKVFIQKLWIAGIDWDDELPPALLQEWRYYRNELEQLVEFHIPRWIGREGGRVMELHGFSDASNIAYAAVVYSRVIDASGVIHTHLLTAKAKVAPIKQVSIPRLELCGSVLVAKLLTEVAKILNIPKTNIHAWTDSSVVLAWLSDHPSRWKTYVANRTSEILSLLDNTQWAHVQSMDNPADMASRGLPSSMLLNSDLWKHGPQWLRNDPVEYTRPRGIRTNEEKRAVKVYTVTLVTDFDEMFGSRFSSLRRLVRVVAYCRRFLQLTRRLQTKIKMTPYLSVPELRESLHLCIRLSQRQWFQAEIVALENNGTVDKKSSLYKFNIFMDENSKLLRVGGRLRNSELPDDAKHPIVIPHDSRLAKLIVANAHERTFHGGQQLVLNFIRNRYWISRVKNLVRTHIHGCVPCIRYAANTKHQLMGELPACRVTPSKPFFNAGVDFAGPINMRFSKGRGQRSYKGYICLFVCMATRAVHIEAVSDLTSEGFLAAFKRFVARRGHCRHIWSDNGTNFVGAAKELQVLFSQETTLFQHIASVLADSQTEWHFIPPHAPNHGGLWEAGVKSAKHHLKRTIGDSTLTFEEMSTVLTQIEACLNSRPLSKDPENPAPLTPGHFLVGQPLVLAPDYNYENATVSTLRRWQLTQRMVQGFWHRWKNEYLTQFFQRNKWVVRSRDFQIDDIVLVKEDNLPPAKWLYGRVVEVHPGKDDITRVVTIRCKDTTFKRPTSKLCLLPATQ